MALDHKYRRRDHRPPSFSSTLLDQIYNSIHHSSMIKKQNRATAGDSVTTRNLKTVEPVFFNHSTSSSSSSSKSRSPPEILHPKPIRTTTTTVERKQEQEHGRFLRTKKVKQPVSPGARLATFLNSIFTGNTKKTSKTNTTTATSSTTWSTKSSFSSSEKSKRSVLNDEHSKQRESIRVIEAAKELVRTFQKKKDVVNIFGEEEEEDDDDDDDGASCASSDLFELDNLWTVGIDRFREELPVYETTRFNPNRFISR